MIASWLPTQRETTLLKLSILVLFRFELIFTLDTQVFIQHISVDTVIIKQNNNMSITISHC